MEKVEKNQNAKEHIDLIQKTFQKTILGFMPGGVVIESFLNYRNDLKANRLLNFTENLKNAIEEIRGTEIDSSNFETEDFVDTMELIYSKVINTRSVLKLERFKDILVKKVIEPENSDYLFKKYITLLDQLDDIQILILSDFNDWYPQKIISIIIAYEGEVGRELKDDAIIKSISEKIDKPITKAEVEFFTNDLVNLGLIRNNAKVITAMGGSSPQNEFQISPIGQSFLEFITIN